MSVVVYVKDTDQSDDAEIVASHSQQHDISPSRMTRFQTANWSLELHQRRAGDSTNHAQGHLWNAQASEHVT